ncbi:MAG: transporter substrate-binding domain-containing protein [Tissierellia bacterium]|nr:transporter substrate-binding domain-containing protein [Tissierellia bacterium]
MKRNLTVVLLLLLVVALTTACASTNAPAEGDGNAEAQELRVGMECGYPPFNWTQLDDSNGAVPIEGTQEFAGGYDVEIAKKVAEGLGRKLVIVKTDWDGLPPAVQSGKIDAIMAGMSPTAERAEMIDFSEPYYNSQLCVVVKADGPYANAKTLSDFSGAKIAAQLNTFHDTVVDQMTGAEHQVPLDNFSTLRVALQSGSIDGYISEKPEAVSAMDALPGLAMIEPEPGFETSPEDTAISVGIKKGSELTASINEILKGISDADRTTIMDAAIVNQPIHQD